MGGGSILNKNRNGVDIMRKKLRELMKLREELKEVGRRIDTFADEAKGTLDDVAIGLNATSLLLSNIETNITDMLCDEIEKSCDKMCDTLDRIDKMEDTLDEDSREE